MKRVLKTVFPPPWRLAALGRAVMNGVAALSAALLVSFLGLCALSAMTDRAIDLPLHWPLSRVFLHRGVLYRENVFHLRPLPFEDPPKKPRPPERLGFPVVPLVLFALLPARWLWVWKRQGIIGSGET